MQIATKNFFRGMALSQAYPVLHQIAEQNGLKLNRLREMRIAMNIMAESIVKN